MSQTIIVPDGIDMTKWTIGAPMSDLAKLAAGITQADKNLAAANLRIEQLERDNAELKTIRKQQEDMLRQANDRIETLIKTPPNPAPVPPPPAPIPIPGEVIGTLPGFATYIVDGAGSGANRTAAMKGHVDKLKSAGIKEVVMFCNHIEINEGILPEYMATKDVGWWTDSMKSIYDVAADRTAKAIADKIPLNKIPDYFGVTVGQCDKFKTQRGFVLDDAQNLSTVEFETIVGKIRQHSKKPIVASFGVLEDISKYLPTITRHRVFVARQLYRTELADEDTSEERTGTITTWLKRPGMICQIGNLEYLKDDDGVITTGDDLRHMYNRCIAAGLKSFMGYAAVDSNGFDVWESPDLWQAFKDCAAAYPNPVKIPVSA